ncbi:SPOUT methyltransferase [Cinnamomum micranthum f. kanehirae]|uniref:SPOUT methyltransferase n=1 Tax=Cinnamomum micranthum f. kanehirae TaxID=337451 RepID=A0A3S3NZX6_9MAGN|nr:SPOUT methyltransferase [Cinnamomum micranthum f. kanehirae]
MATIASPSSCIKTTIPSPGRRFKYSGEYVVIIFNHYMRERFSERALPIHILTIGNKRFQGIQAQLIVEEYNEKLKHYGSVDDVQIKSNPKNTSDVMAQIKGEDNIIIQHIRSEDWESPLNLHMLTKTLFYYYY